MKTITKIRFLNALGLFNIVRIMLYRIEMLNSKYMSFYANFIKKGFVCFDIGGNIGRKTDIFLKLGAAKVIVVEPNPECIQFLKWKYRNNNQVQIIQKAIGNKIETKEMFICEANSLSSLSPEWIQKTQHERYQQFEWKSKIQVLVTTLDQLIKEYGKPDFCKIDVEGYELLVLEGLTQHVPMLSFEFAPETLPNIKQCIQHLNKLGMHSFNYSKGESPESLSLQTWVKGEELMTIFQNNPASAYGEIYVR